MNIKVKITDTTKRITAVADMPLARRVAAESNEGLADMVQMAANYVCESNSKVFEATAEVAKNGRAWDLYFDGSKDFDVWIEFKAFSDFCEGKFCIVGAYLSDVYQIGDGEDKKRYMYIRTFKEVK